MKHLLTFLMVITLALPSYAGEKEDNCDAFACLEFGYAYAVRSATEMAKTICDIKHSDETEECATCSCESARAIAFMMGKVLDQLSKKIEEYCVTEDTQ